MSGLPKVMTRKTLTHEPYLGSDARGRLYGPARELRTYVESVNRALRSPDGRITVATLSCWVPLDYTIGPEDRITYRGEVRDVLAVQHFDAELGTSDHTVITVQ